MVYLLLSRRSIDAFVSNVALLANRFNSISTESVLLKANLIKTNAINFNFTDALHAQLDSIVFDVHPTADSGNINSVPTRNVNFPTTKHRR